MAIVSVMYPAKDGSKFDMDYYLHKHMPMVAETWKAAGLRGYTVLRGVASPDGSAAPWQLMVNLDFVSRDAFLAALESGGGKVMGDVPNFTDLQPSLQISEEADRFTVAG